MFQFLFKYPIPVFTKGRFVLLGAWPGWVLLLLVAMCVAALGLLIRLRLPGASPKLRTWRAGVLWLLQSLLIATLLLLLWQPAITVAELSSQQNIIAVVVDDSRSMATADSGRGGKLTREDAAVKALEDGVLAGLQKRFQTRLYRIDSRLARVAKLDDIHPSAPATRLSGGLKQFVAETSDLPIGAIVLLSDGSENSLGGAGNIDADAINALRNRRLPVHTVGFGKEQLAHDVEINDVSVASHATAHSRISAAVSFHQRGYAGSKATLLVRDGASAISSREITLGPDGIIQVQRLFLDAGAAGIKTLQFSLGPLAGEENLLNNSITRPVRVSDDKRRILYVEGEPRWEYKFIRRAEDDDNTVQLVSMLRTTENKIYRQGISNPTELQDGFPVRPEDLFPYQGIVIGSVEAGYFTPLQQELLREFVDRRGGGLLFLGGRFSLTDGGWGGSSLTDLLPVFLPKGGTTFHREHATVELTAAGADSPITRLMDDPATNVERWKKLTYLMDYQDPGSPKPGATVLAEMNAGRRKLPLLITENYGRGRTAVLATSGTWRWQMGEPLGDPDHDHFWQQLLRWLVEDSPGQVVVSAPTRVLMDDGRMQISASVRDNQYMPAPNTTVAAHFMGPSGSSAVVDMLPVPGRPGEFHTDWNAEKPGSYLVEVTAERGAQSARGTGKPAGAAGQDDLGRDVLAFQRTDGIAENFHTEQNRDLLEKLAAETGGRYWTARDFAKLPNEISYSDAGISVRETKDLWNMPVVFLWLLGLVCAEWFLRRKWGVV